MSIQIFPTCGVRADASRPAQASAPVPAPAPVSPPPFPQSLPGPAFDQDPSEGQPFCGPCDEWLSLSQPDEARPFRLLGVCPKCGVLYAIDGEPEYLGRGPRNQIALHSLTEWWTSNVRVY